MTKLLGLFLTLTLLAFGVAAQADDTKPQRPISLGPDLSGFEKGRSFEVLHIIEAPIALMKKYDPIRARKLENRLKQNITLLDRVLDGERRLIQINDKIDIEEKKHRDGSVDDQFLRILLIDKNITRNNLNEFLGLYSHEMHIKYRDMGQNPGEKWDEFASKLGRWIVDYNEMRAQKRQSIGLPKEPLDGLKIKEEIKQEFEERKKAPSPKDESTRAEETKKEAAEPEKNVTALQPDGGTGRTPAKQNPTALACNTLGGEWHGGTLAKVRQIATGWKKELSSCSAGTNDCRIFRGGSSFQAYMKTLMIWQCHATFVRLSKKGSDEDRTLAREEGCTIEKTLEKMAEQIKATGFMTVGASWKPLHIDMSEKWELKDLCDTGKIEEAGSGSGKEAKPDAPLVAEAEPKKDCKPGGGLLGAMNCVTKRIEGAGGSGAKTPDSASSTDTNAGTTTTSVKNPDGSRTVTKTDKDGNVLSKKTVRKSPTSASSTDKKTGVTTTSVRNPDGTRTVTKTDKDGNVLSRERVGKSPDSASSTVLNTGETTKSVANPDGSRTVTITDKDGNVLSREKVR